MVRRWENEERRQCKFLVMTSNLRSSLETVVAREGAIQT